MTRELTAHEFAEKHIGDTGCRESADVHLDRLIRTALDDGRDLWKVHVDEAGNVTFEWLTMDERLWDALLDKATAAVASAELDALIARTFPG